LTSTLDGGEWSVKLPGHFIPRERALRAHWIGDGVGPRAVLDAVVVQSEEVSCHNSGICAACWRA